MAKLDGYKFELTTGFLTGFFGIVHFLFACSTDLYTAKPLNNIWDFVTTVLFLLGIPLFIAAGSYIHAVKRNFGGILMIAIGAFLSILMICIVLLHAAFSGYYPFFLMALAPHLMGINTLIIAIIEKFTRTKTNSSSTPENLSA